MVIIPRAFTKCRVAKMKQALAGRFWRVYFVSIEIMECAQFHYQLDSARKFFFE